MQKNTILLRIPYWSRFKKFGARDKGIVHPDAMCENDGCAVLKKWRYKLFVAVLKDAFTVGLTLGVKHLTSLGVIFVTANLDGKMTPEIGEKLTHLERK
jgi:hypothetical protein